MTAGRFSVRVCECGWVPEDGKGCNGTRLRCDLDIVSQPVAKTWGLYV